MNIISVSPVKEEVESRQRVSNPCHLHHLNSKPRHFLPLNIMPFGLLFIAFLFCFLPLNAQSDVKQGGKIIFPSGAKGFKKLDTDLSTKFKLKKKDTNGKDFAILRISNNTEQKGFVVTIGVQGNAEVSYGVGVMYVYLPEGVKLMRIRHPKYGESEIFRFPMPILAGQVYQLDVLFTGGIGKRVVVIDEESILGSYLKLQINPHSAQVVIDNGNPSYALSNGFFTSTLLSAGRHQLTISSGMYKTYVESFEIKDKVLRKDIQLVPDYSVLNITSQPSGATILLDDEEIGKTPFTTKRLKNGKHTLRLSINRYDAKLDTLILSSEGDTIGKHYELVENFGNITIQVGPTPDIDQQAQIFVDNDLKGSGKWTGILMPGRHKIEIRESSHVSTFKDFKVVKGQTKTITLDKLVPLYGSLDVTARTVPANVMMQIDQDEPVLLPYIRSNDIFIGDHMLSFEAEGFSSKQISVHIDTGKIYHLDVELSQIYYAKTVVKISPVNDFAPKLYIDGKIRPSLIDGDTLTLGKHLLEIRLKFDTAFHEEHELEIKPNVVNTFVFDLPSEFNDPQVQYNLGLIYYTGEGCKKDYSKAFAWFTKSANQGHSDAQCKLGDLYRYGEGVAPSYTKAVTWYTKSSNQGNSDASHNMAFLCVLGLGVERNFQEAFAWDIKSANQGGSEAKRFLGDLYYHGVYEERNYQEALAWYTKAANLGDSESQRKVGSMYYCGEGVEVNYQEAIVWYTKSANQGDSYAQDWLGDMYANGEGVEVNYQEAIVWYTKAANQDQSGAQNMLGDMYYFGKGIDVNYNEAFAWYTKSANHGHSGAQNMLGDMYYFGKGIDVNYNEAFAWYTKSANHGHSDAQNKLGVMYKNGDGVEVNYQEAFAWYTKSANQDDSDGQYNLGLMFYEGKGCIKNYSTGIDWIKKSALQGNCSAQNWLGGMYRDGEGVEVNYQEAFAWFTKSAKQGDSDGQYLLGYMYYYGKGCEENNWDAKKWFEKSALQGNSHGQNWLGNMYRVGAGMSKDYQEAIAWYTKSADQGDSDGQYLLGYMYYYGKGYKKDKREAKKWFEKSALQGNSAAQYHLGLMYYKGKGCKKNHTTGIDWIKKSALQGNSKAKKWINARY